MKSERLDIPTSFSILWYKISVSRKWSTQNACIKTKYIPSSRNNFDRFYQDLASLVDCALWCSGTEGIEYPYLGLLWWTSQWPRKTSWEQDCVLDKISCYLILKHNLSLSSSGGYSYFQSNQVFFTLSFMYKLFDFTIFKGSSLLRVKTKKNSRCFQDWFNTT